MSDSGYMIQRLGQLGVWNQTGFPPTIQVREDAIAKAAEQSSLDHRSVYRVVNERGTIVWQSNEIE